LPANILEVVFPSTNGLLKCFQGLCSEGRVATHDNIEDDSTSPEVTFLIVVPLDNFWSHVVGGPEKLRKPLMRPDSARYTEVNKLDINALIAEILALHRLLDILD
jgi:hypothetical protein